jgi:hypothetical protein
MPANYVFIENVSQLKSAAKGAAALNVITNFFTYSQGKEQRRPKQAIYFQEPEVFYKKMPGFSPATNFASYQFAKDVRRQKQAIYFQEPEVFLKPQTGNLVVTLATQADTNVGPLNTVRYVSIENLSVIKSNRGTLLVLAQAPPGPAPVDVFISQDINGWPIEMFEPPYFVSKMPSSFVVLNSFPAYNVATDIKRARQAIYFQEPEVFLLPMRGWFGGGPAQNFTVYNPGTDVRRQIQARFFQEPEVFLKPWAYNPVILNGTAAPLQPVPNVILLTQAAAVALLFSDNFIDVAISFAFDTITPAGIVIAQNPVAGTLWPPTGLIQITVSAGPFVPGSPVNPPMKVTTRNFSLEEMVAREWGSSFRAPDHRVYVFSNNRGFDSTDIGTTGFYAKGTKTI